MSREGGGEVEYLVAYVNEPAEVLKFLALHLGFLDHTGLLDGQPPHGGLIAGDRFGNNFLFVARTASNSGGQRGEMVTIHTPNLLRDYRRLCSGDVKIEQAPRYTGIGLELIFCDNYGNRYFLIEKRDYRETI